MDVVIEMEKQKILKERISILEEDYAELLIKFTDLLIKAQNLESPFTDIPTLDSGMRNLRAYARLGQMSSDLFREYLRLERLKGKLKND